MGRTRNLPTDNELYELYTKQHLTQQQIADKYGVCRQAVHKALKLLGVDGSDGTQVKAKCAYCKKVVSKLRVHWRRARKHYCNTECYTASMKNPDFIANRYGQLRARKEVLKYFTLLPGMVVHHHDSNQGNDNIDNLAVFANQADHMSFERGGDARPIWDGRTVRKQAASILPSYC